MRQGSAAVVLGALVALVMLSVSGAIPGVELAGLYTSLGASLPLFVLLGLAFAIVLVRLAGTFDMADAAEFERIVRLDQLSEVLIQLFVGVGVGVVWTAIGMRDALVAALANTDAALADSAGDVLAALVDGGILVALTSTIVGGLGGYGMKLLKSLLLGGTLHAFYADHAGRDVRALLATVRRIEAMLDAGAAPGECPREEETAELATPAAERFVACGSREVVS